MQKSIGKWEIRSFPCKIVTPKNFNLKLCTRDYVGETTHHVNFGLNRYSGGFSPHGRNITTLWLVWLSCPVLSCPFFFLGTRPGRTAEPIFTLYGSNDVFPHKEVPFGGSEWWVTSFGRNMSPTPLPPAPPPKKWLWIGNFKPKHRNIKMTISPKL